MINIQFKRTYIKPFLILLTISFIYLLASRKTTTTTTPHVHIVTIQTQPKAYIITADCRSIRFNITKINIERVFPNYFDIRCFLSVSLNDSRIHTSSSAILKKWSSNLLAFVDLWTYEIPKSSNNNNNNNEFEWSFIFEDDVNFCDPSQVSLLNFIEPLQELTHNQQIQQNDGFVYLGICGPDFNNSSPSIIFKNTKNSLKSEKGYGFCLHATGITTKRSRTFWSEISSYRPNEGDKSLDHQLRQYSLRSRKYFYTFGSNYLYPPGTGHYGIAYQDRGKFGSSIS
ncbi:unnamed protein product [Adineta steineri]|uniref:Uncharacterized protein n=1 Tax=Adineta steineri TaxID=433720 RepID=A0A814QK46_9BILA|nr:unnamed protein product [Adineta steineri]CAF3767843.1 unnamed protein product [Adineta steineri]